MKDGERYILYIETKRERGTSRRTMIQRRWTEGEIAIDWGWSGEEKDVEIYLCRIFLGRLVSWYS